MNWRVFWKASTREVTLKPAATTTLAGFVDIGTFAYTPRDNSDGYDRNKVFFHYIQDLLYKIGVQDLQRVQINSTKRVDSISLAPASTTKAAGETQQLTVTWNPADADNKDVTWSSDNPSKATVNAAGLVTFVAAGKATITASTDDGSRKASADIIVT